MKASLLPLFLAAAAALFLADHAAALVTKASKTNAKTKKSKGSKTTAPSESPTAAPTAALNTAAPTASPTYAPTGAACRPACYEDPGRWTDKCAAPECADCAPCRYEDPAPGDLRSVCPAFNVLANHGLIPRDGRHNNYAQNVAAMQTYFGCQRETALLIFQSFAGLAAMNGIAFDIADFDLTEIVFNIKQTSWINDDVTKRFNPSKFERLERRADADGKITNWDLLDHVKAVITQARCNGRWDDARYEGGPVGPRLGYVGDIPFMMNFVSSPDFQVKVPAPGDREMGYFSPIAAALGYVGLSFVPYMNYDIEYLRAIFNGRFPDDYLPRKCDEGVDCFGQAFGRILDPFVTPGFGPGGGTVWPEAMIDTYNAMEPEPDYAYMTEHANEQLLWTVYRELAAEDCAADYYDEGSVGNFTVVDPPYGVEPGGNAASVGGPLKPWPTAYDKPDEKLDNTFD